MLINKVIPSLTGGISQQEPVLRLDTQCEDSVNSYGTLVDGLIKRPPSEHIAVLTSSNADTKSYIHSIDRDETERYKAVFTGDATKPIEIYDTYTGTECLVKYGILNDDLTYTVDNTIKSYVTTSDPKADLRALTISDYTLITNTNKVCVMDSTAVEGSLVNEAIIYVKKGVAQTDYNIFINDVKSATYTTGDTTNYTSYKSDNIANELYNDLATLATNQLAIGFSSMTDTTGTVSLSLEGTAFVTNMPVVLTFVSEFEGGHYEVDATATATAFYDAIQAHDYDKNIWGVFKAGNTVYIKKYGTSTFTYSVTNTGSTAPTVTAPSSTGNWDITYIQNTSVIKIKRLDNSDFKIEASDSWSDQALLALKGSIQNFTDLPNVAFNDFIVEIAGSPDSAFDNYYVKYVKDSKSGVWQEVVKPGLYNSFDSTTMPHELVRLTELSGGYPVFIFSPINWSKRTVGDTNTLPPPSFIGKTITDLFFYRNRLGMLSGENVIFSKVSDFFNFWSTTATAVLDDDPIDYAVSANEVATLYYALPFNTSLLALAKNQQFQIGSGTSLLTSKTMTADPTTNFETSPKCKPVGVGSNIYFISPRGDASSIREYFVQPGSLTNDAADITAHVPFLIPPNVTKMAASSTLDVLTVYSDDTPDTLYIYKYYWQGDQKAQSAWFKWELDGTIFSMDFVGTSLYLIIQRDTSVCLEKIRLERFHTGDLPYKVNLDRLCTLTGSYNISTDTTTWTLPYSDTNSGYVLVDSDTGGLVYNTSKPTSNTMTAFGDYSDRVVYAGKTYSMQHTLSEWKIKAPNSNVAVQQGRLIVRNLSLSFSNTGYFRIETTPFGRSTSTRDYTPTLLGSSRLDNQTVSSETKRFFINTKSEGTTINIINDTHLPSEFQAGSFEGFYTARSKSI